MGWKEQLLRVYAAIKPETVSAEDQAVADQYTKEQERRERERKMAEYKANAKKNMITWSPVEANKRMLERVEEK